MFSFKKDQMVSPDQALKGRNTPMLVADQHYVLKTPMNPPYEDGTQTLVVGLGCFWGAEKRFWSVPGVVCTAVGYSAGYTLNPTYEEVCSGQTGHNEVVLIVYQPEKISTEELLKYFWEAHNPTQGMRQGNDRGTQYRSGIYYFNEQQQAAAEITKNQYQLAVNERLGHMPITTEILPAGEFYFAETYHQQYLAKNPNGYCGLGGLGVCF